MRLLGICCLVLVTVTGFAVHVSGHGGGLDSYAGHNDRKSGGYHFHQGPLAGRSFPSKEAGLAALRALEEPKPRAPAPNALAEDGPSPAEAIRAATTAKKADALIAALIRKGLVTEAELARELQARR